MSDYFKPWRRKFGVITLVTACCILVIWMKTHSKCTSIELPTNDDNVISTLSSFRGVVTWVHFQSGPYPYEGFVNADLPDGSSFGGDGTGPLTIRYARYWWIVLPLTLLSAWLLLSKPRSKRTQ